MAQERLERTCWRGIQVDHPADWEVAIASGIDDGGHLRLVDRRFARLDVKWRPLTYVPNLDLMQQRFREPKSTREKVDVSRLTSVPVEWKGVIRKSDEGNFVHAGRFFPDSKTLVEVTIVWPQRRDLELECDILQSVAVQDKDSPTQHWLAMGLDVMLEQAFELVVNDPKAGRIAWTFRGGKKRRETSLLVERIAMADVWLKDPLEDWLVSGLPKGSEVLRQGETTFNGHGGRELLSRRRMGTLFTLRGLRQVRLDVAWRCPVDERLYHLACWRMQREKELILPSSLRMDCCKSAPVPAKADA